MSGKSKKLRIEDIDDDIVNVKKFAILSILYLFGSLTESDIVKILGISWGSLSTHIKKLAELGYVRLRKVITDKGPRTLVEITEEGRRKYEETYRKLRKLLELMEQEKHGGSGQG